MLPFQPQTFVHLFGNSIVCNRIESKIAFAKPLNGKLINTNSLATIS